jgi:cytochrome b6
MRNTTEDREAGAGGREPPEGLRGWLEERFDFAPVREFIEHKVVPVHSATPWYYLGGITLFLFFIQVATGLLLLLYYRPTPDEAFESVKYVMTRVPFGWLIRSIHSWSANLMVFTAFLHMFSTYFLRSYRKPRELTWMSGVVLLGLLLGFGFSGYLLPWNTLAFFATKVGTEVAGSMPLVGRLLLVILRGGEEVTGATLTRFFAFHVAILPACLLAFLGIHLLLIQQQGMSMPLKIERELERRAEQPRVLRFFPNFFLRELMAWYAGLAVLGALAALHPWELGSKADAFASAPAGIRPEWYFLAEFQTLKMIPGRLLGLNGEILAVVAMGAAGLFWFFIPLLDRPDQEKRYSAFFPGLGVLAIAYLVTFSILGYLK